MHLIISHAGGIGPQCQAAIAHLQLPHLNRLLRLSGVGATHTGTPGDLTPLAERVQAQALGLEGADGLLPWAAMAARQQGLDSSNTGAGWAWITPCHWQARAPRVEMGETQTLALAAGESTELRMAMAPYFAEDGIALHPHTPQHWLAHGAVLRDLPTASLARVAGSTINPWLPRQPQASTLRRLQSEMQMLLYTHAVNTAREAQGLPSVNAFWVSGTGTLDAAWHASTPEPAMVQTLRPSALRDDAPAWTAAWQELDATLLAGMLQRLPNDTSQMLTVCGEHRAVTLRAALPRPWWQRLRQHLRTPSVPVLLQSL